MINPIYNITVSDEAFLKLKIMRANHFEEVKKIITHFYAAVNNEYWKEGKPPAIESCLEIMHHLLEQKVKNTKDFLIIIKKFIPNHEKYNAFIDKLNELEPFDLFIDKISKVNDETSCLLETFQCLTHMAIKELEAKYLSAKESEMQDQMMKEKNELITKYQHSEKEHQKQITQLTIDMEHMQSRHYSKIEQLTNDRFKQNAQSEKDKKAFLDRIEQLTSNMIKQQNESNQKNIDLTNTLVQQQKDHKVEQEKCLQLIEQLKKDLSDQKNNYSKRIQELETKIPKSNKPNRDLDWLMGRQTLQSNGVCVPVKGPIPQNKGGFVPFKPAIPQNKRGFVPFKPAIPQNKRVFVSFKPERPPNFNNSECLII